MIVSGKVCVALTCLAVTYVPYRREPFCQAVQATCLHGRLKTTLRWYQPLDPWTPGKLAETAVENIAECCVAFRLILGIATFYLHW